MVYFGPHESGVALFVPGVMQKEKVGETMFGTTNRDEETSLQTYMSK